ncbi:hypothetical protein H4R18_000899 [Coemansia javaensis]|uniref:Cytochrome P450 n=1 Tax=Coemansia javaensis TaxID=2761396 RepID=A0A9W8HN25_9FUNG|nr:hypothetical protein H4R18_000899 [Coemansia javaensis]
MNGAGGNSTRLLYDDDDDFNNGTPLCSVMFSAVTLALVLVAFKVIYERWVTPLAEVPGSLLHSLTSIPMRYYMLRGRMPEFVEALHQRYGPVVRISPQRVSFSDIAAAKQILGSHAFVKTPAYSMPSPIEPNTFSTLQPEVSVERRKQLGPGFSHRHLAAMESSIRQCCVINVQRKIDALLAAHADGRAVIQYNKWFSLITLDTIGVLGFGQQFRALERERHDLVPVLNRIRAFNYITMALPWLKGAPKLLGGRLRTLATLLSFSQRAIDERRSQPAASGSGSNAPDDLLQRMLDESRAGARPLTDPQMVSETILHLIAGVDTTSSGLTWTLALLLHNPHIMQRLTADIRREFPDRARPITFEDCRQRLPYLAAVVSESLRVLCPAPSILPRVTPPGGVRMGGYFMPAGTWMCCAVNSVHMNPAVFRSPHAFNPDRFLADSPERHSLLAFSTGVRACLGRNLAIVEMYIVLSNLLRNYDLCLPDDAAAVAAQPVADDCKAFVGSVPDIPRNTMMTLNPTHPDRDCLVVVSAAT